MKIFDFHYTQDDILETYRQRVAVMVYATQLEALMGEFKAEEFEKEFGKVGG